MPKNAVLTRKRFGDGSSTFNTSKEKQVPKGIHQRNNTKLIKQQRENQTDPLIFWFFNSWLNRKKFSFENLV
jgi:hypothetical protein